MEDFVTYEVAKKLKEKGFKFNKDYRLDRFFMANEINTPTIAQVLKWLREEKKLHIAVDIWSREWGYDVLRLMGGDNLHWSGIANYKNYEEAALAGIEYVLDNLI